MKVSESLTIFIMLLLLIVLLLTIVILGVILWSLVVCLHPLVSDVRNRPSREHTKKKGKIWSKEDKTDPEQNDSEKCMSLVIEDAEPLNQYDGQGWYHREENIHDWNQYDITEQNKEWQRCDEIEEEVFAAEELRERNIEIRLTLANLKEVSYYQGKALLEESEDGEIVIYKKSGEEYYAYPSKDSINERSYAYTALKSCFDVSSDVESSYSYSVRVIASCILSKDKNFYTVKRKGKLQINKEN